MPFITWADYLLLPVFLFLIYRIALLFCNRHYPPGHPWRSYFLYGLGVKVFGAIFIGLIYQYYYHGGDTEQYFLHAKIINSAFSESFIKWIGLILHMPASYAGEYYFYTCRMEWYNDKGSYMVCCLAAFINVFTLNTFLPTSIIFAALSFTGIWAMFRTFAQQYGHLTRYIAFAILFIPSCFIWGSGIFKDTLCISALGWLLYSSFLILIKRKVTTGNLLLLLISIYLLFIVKVYIVISFLPAVGLWILFSYAHRIRSAVARFLITSFLLLGSIMLFSAVYSYFSPSLGKYSLDNIAKTSLVTRDWIAYTSGEQGSAYNLGNFEPTLGGLLSKFPQAVNVTLFRPYIWEAKKPIVLLNAMESLMFLFVTLKVLYTVGLRNIRKTVTDDPTIQFCLIFSIIFAFSIGVSTYNFGSLSRYKIPCLPLYGLALVLIYYKNKPLNSKLLF